MTAKSTDFYRPSPAEIEADWLDFTGGAPVYGLLAVYEAGDVEALAFRDHDSHGLISWSLHGPTAELVSIHCEPPGRGLGTTLLEAFEDAVRRQSAQRVVVATTNDNLEALAFYQKRGYRLARVHNDAMERVRQAKKHIPLTGLHGIPLRDIVELEKAL